MLAYDPTRKSLYGPGDAEDFFCHRCRRPDLKLDFLCAEMARLAYVKEPGRLDGYLRRAGFDLVATLGYQNARGTQVFIARGGAHSPWASTCVIAFRGTEPDDPADVISDAKLFRVPWFDRAGAALGTVHGGFADALLRDGEAGDVLERILPHLSPIAQADGSLLLTGHSLGGALAILAASRLTGAGYRLGLYTFGAPRVGDSGFVAATAGIDHARYVNGGDLVTRIPPERLGYRHGGRLCYIDRKGRVLPEPPDARLRRDGLLAGKLYLLHHGFRSGNVLLRRLADHSPVNYLSGVGGLRG